MTNLSILGESLKRSLKMSSASRQFGLRLRNEKIGRRNGESGDYRGFDDDFYDGGPDSSEEATQETATPAGTPGPERRRRSEDGAPSLVRSAPGTRLLSIDDEGGSDDGSDGGPEKSGRPAAKAERRPASLIVLTPSSRDLVRSERFFDWASSVRRLDPRLQIKRCFDDVARSGERRCMEGEGDGRTRRWSRPERSDQVPVLLRSFCRSAVFTVWRPTSRDAIRKMMAGEGVGKGLDVKGKSALRGELSGFVPFVQIHEEDHKGAVRSLSKTGRIRIFYRRRDMRDAAASRLSAVSEEMAAAARDARAFLSDPIRRRCGCPERREAALRRLAAWDVADPSVAVLDHCAARGCYGVEVAERAFWEAYVMRRSIVREERSRYDTGRGSEPSFQDMNFASTRNAKEDGGPRAVVWQHADGREDDPMQPQSLLMAYEEGGRVLPVVSDFDCFCVGSKGIAYRDPLPPEQVDTMRWCVDQIEQILDGPDSSHPWTTRWLNVLKSGGKGKKKAKMPRFGYGDPKSYSIMEYAVQRLEENGAVRHGAECFNYYFPQDLDDRYLFVGDGLPGGAPWTYVTCAELQDLLCRKIDDGYTFPLNPKWIACDGGWKRVYDRLVASDAPHVRQSLDAWFPPVSGLREKIESICARHPHGFRRRAFDGLVVDDDEIRRLSEQPSLKRHATESMDLAFLMLERHRTLQRVKRKLRAVGFWMKLLRSVRLQRNLGVNGEDAHALNQDVDGVDADAASAKEIQCPPPLLCRAEDAHAVNQDGDGEDADAASAEEILSPPLLISPSPTSRAAHRPPLWTSIGSDSVRLA